MVPGVEQGEKTYECIVAAHPRKHKHRETAGFAPIWPSTAVRMPRPKKTSRSSRAGQWSQCATRLPRTAANDGAPANPGPQPHLNPSSARALWPGTLSDTGESPTFPLYRRVLLHRERKRNRPRVPPCAPAHPKGGKEGGFPKRAQRSESPYSPSATDHPRYQTSRPRIPNTPSEKGERNPPILIALSPINPSGGGGGVYHDARRARTQQAGQARGGRGGIDTGQQRGSSR